jgi:hypothetical protein
VLAVAAALLMNLLLLLLPRRRERGWPLTVPAFDKRGL